MSNEALANGAPGEKALFLGNEAIARGVLESGVQVVAAYPGTPSSEIVDSLARVAKQTGQNVEWSTNEKVAFECAAGAAFLGVRSFSAMKSVGLNVAMDPLMVVNLTGVAGGFVFLVADDPNCWSTQNEQDSRLLAYAAEIPCLEPASVQEAKDIVPYAYELSDSLGRVVMIRTVTRLNHARAPVTLGPFHRNEQIPRYHSQRAGFPALPKHKLLHEEKDRFKQALSSCPFNKLDLRPEARVGIVASGNATNYAREAISALELDGAVSFLQVGVINPLPEELIERILVSHETVVIFEEIEPFIERQIRALCYDFSCHPRLIGKLSGDLGVAGELTREKAIQVLTRASGLSSTVSTPQPSHQINELILNRNIVLCAGCSHMATFYAIRKAAKKQKARVLISGDIGCYGLGLFPPYDLFDSHICMGASIGVGNGYAATGYEGPVICVIGDSTLYHSGVPPLINAVFNKHKITVVVLDNSIIGMTGHQPAPGTGRTATGESTKKVDIAQLVRACGVARVTVVDPFKLEHTIASIKEAIKHEGPSVVVARGECAILTGRKQGERRTPWHIDPEKCDSCSACVNLLYCPALTQGGDYFTINQELCAGCGVCAQICPKSAIDIGASQNNG
jgi:indolepyruvate ferredoxin oxidoreductase alpha subunit